MFSICHFKSRCKHLWSFHSNFALLFSERSPFSIINRIHRQLITWVKDYTFCFLGQHLNTFIWATTFQIDLIDLENLGGIIYWIWVVVDNLLLNVRRVLLGLSQMPFQNSFIKTFPCSWACKNSSRFVLYGIFLNFKTVL